MKYYVYDYENGATDYDDLQLAVENFLSYDDTIQYVALGVKKDCFSVDLYIRGKYLKDKNTSFKISTDYLSSTLYEEDPAGIFEVINRIRKIIETKSEGDAQCQKEVIHSKII